MKKSKLALKLVAIVILGWISIYAAFAVVGRFNSRDVREICKIKVGTPVEEVIPAARTLGFGRPKAGLAVFALRDGYSTDGNRPLEFHSDTLPGIRDGRIMVYKVTRPPFGRESCSIEFRERIVTQTKISAVD